MPGRKGNTEKGKGRGQASEKSRGPFHLAWKRVQVRGAKVHACGAQIKQEFQEIAEEFKRFRWKSKKEKHAGSNPSGTFRKFADIGLKRKKRGRSVFKKKKREEKRKND